MFLHVPLNLWEALKGVGVDGVGGFPALHCLLFWLPFFSLFFLFFFAFLPFSHRTQASDCDLLQNGNFTPTPSAPTPSKTSMNLAEPFLVWKRCLIQHPDLVTRHTLTIASSFSRAHLFIHELTEKGDGRKGTGQNGINVV